jgi:hypothetical protein
MKIALELTSALDNKSRKIVAAFPDFIAFENKFNRSVAKFETELTLTDLAYLGWHAEHRLKKTGLDFESWCDEIESLEVGDAAEAVIVPLEISQPTG